MSLKERWFLAGRHRLRLGERTLVMGIVNVTPDSFSDGGLAYDLESAVAQGLRLIEEGADILDIGGESTRPGSDPVPLNEELRRVLPVTLALASRVNVPISIDTYKAEVAWRALEAGASIVNDISAGDFDQRMPGVVAEARAGAVLMHIKGTPRDMQVDPRYEDVVGEVRDYLVAAGARFEAAGVSRERLLVDPGIGFGKRLEHNLELIRNLGHFQGIAAGVLFGPSRKSFIGALNGRPVAERLTGTIAAISAGVFAGADIVRVHDVREVVDALKVADALRPPSRQSASPLACGEDQGRVG